MPSKKERDPDDVHDIWNVAIGKPYRGQVVEKIDMETSNLDSGKVKIRRLIYLDNQIILIEDTYHEYGEVYVDGKHLPYNEIQFPPMEDPGPMGGGGNGKGDGDDDEAKRKKRDLLRKQAKDMLNRRTSNSALPVDTSDEPSKSYLDKDDKIPRKPGNNNDDDDDDITVFVKTPNGKELPIKICPDATVGDLKEKIEDDHDFPVAEQNLSFNDKPLDDDDPDATLKDRGVRAGDVIDLLPENITVHVKTPDGKTLPVTVKPNDTVNDLKQKFEEDHNIPVEDQTLSFNGKPLDNPSATLSNDCGFKDGDSVDLLPAGGAGDMEITIKTPEGKMLPITVSPNDKVRDLKKKVEANHGIPAEDQSLRIPDSSTRLEKPQATLHSYGVKDGDILEMEPYDATITVRIRTPNGKKLRVKVQPTESVEDFKNKIAGEHNIPVDDQDLTFKGKPLDDPALTLHDCGIKHGDIIDLNANDMNVIVRTPAGEEISIPVNVYDSIRKLKKKVKAKHGVPVEDQDLVWKGEPLDDPESTLEDLGVSDGDVIDLGPSNQDTINVTVRSPDGNEYPIQIKPSDTIRDIKQKLQQNHDIPENGQQLSLKGMPLDDAQAAAEACGIRDGDILDLLGDKIHLTIKTPDGKKLPVVVTPNDTVRDLKQMVEDDDGIPVADQNLSLDGKPLDKASETMRDIAVKDGDTIDLMPSKKSKSSAPKKDKTRVRTLGPNSAWVYPSADCAPKEGEKNNLQGVWATPPGKEAGKEPVEVCIHPKDKEPVAGGKTVHGQYGYINGAKPDADGVVDPINIVFYPPEGKPDRPDFEMVGYWSSPESSKETTVSWRFEGADMIHFKKTTVSFMGTEMTFTSEYTR